MKLRKGSIFFKYLHEAETGHLLAYLSGRKKNSLYGLKSCKEKWFICRAKNKLKILDYYLQHKNKYN